MVSALTRHRPLRVLVETRQAGSPTPRPLEADLGLVGLPMGLSEKILEVEVITTPPR